MGAAVQAARPAGWSGLSLRVVAANPRARHFYAAAGWAPDGVSKDVDVAGTMLQEVRYRLAL